MTVTDIITNDGGISTDFVRWLWQAHRDMYTLILLGHVELITNKLIQEYEHSIQFVRR